MTNSNSSEAGRVREKCQEGCAIIVMIAILALGYESGLYAFVLHCLELLCEKLDFAESLYWAERGHPTGFKGLIVSAGLLVMAVMPVLYSLAIVYGMCLAAVAVAFDRILGEAPTRTT